MFKLTRSKDDQQPPAASYSMPLLPLRDIVVFPSMVVPLFVGRDKSINALDKAMNTDKKIFLSAQTKAKTDNPGESDIYRIGTVANILQILRLPDGTVKVLVEGDCRARIVGFVTHPEYFFVNLEALEESSEDGVEIEALRRGVRSAFESYAKHNKKITQEVLEAVAAVDHPSRLADTIAAYMPFKIETKQKVLETTNVTQRLETLFGLIRSEIEIIQTEERIKGRVKKQMEKTQREYYLNEQMRAIQKEM
ncbi:MAG: LON peptidase substrate-binding domain-containing protein, partial [Desulfobacteraceae bacterium]|nr:LON peptidase substrate-binding domain-containing protein [Desulfobacteraceae bacterium]